MGIYGGPNTVEDGLVLALDAGNVKSNSEISVKWNNVIADATTVSSVGVITCLSVDTASSNFFGVKWTTCGGTTNEFDNRPPSIANMNTILENFLDCKPYQTGTYNSAGGIFGGYGAVGNICTLRFTGFGVGALIGVGGYFNAVSRQCRLTGDLVNSPVTITSPSGGFADPIVLTSDPADIQFSNPGSSGDPMYVYWLGPYNQVPYSIRSNPGYVNGATYSSDDGGALVFDGTDDYVSITNISNGTDDFTYEAWVYPTESGKDNPAVIYDNSLVHICGIYNTSGGTNAIFGASTRPGSGNDVLYAPDITLNTWHHIAWVKSGSSLKIYVDGVNQTLTDSGSFSGTQSNNVSYIGTTLSNEYFEGYISNAKIYKGKGLTAAEVEQNYNATKGRYA